jgi:hypothetical protein
MSLFSFIKSFKNDVHRQSRTDVNYMNATVYRQRNASHTSDVREPRCAHPFIRMVSSKLMPTAYRLILQGTKLHDACG